MPIRVTNKQIPVRQDYFDFAPRWSLEKGEYAKARITPIDQEKESRFSINKDRKQVLRRSGDLGEPESTWPYMPTTDETVWFSFLDKITDSDNDNRFYPARDEDRRPTPKTGAMHAITDIIRLKTADDTEFLLSKGFVIGHDAAGETLDHPLPWPERWYKTIFSWQSEYNQNTKGFVKRCLGPMGVEVQYSLDWSKENAKKLFDSRAASKYVNFVVKQEGSDEAKMVEPDVNAQKTFDRFVSNSFDFLWSGEYIPLTVRQERRQEAVGRGWIKGGAGDYQLQAEPSKAGKTTYQ